jgi:hypothetical protein
MEGGTKDEGSELMVSYQSFITFVWLWECARDHARKKVGFQRIMQSTVQSLPEFSAVPDRRLLLAAHI